MSALLASLAMYEARRALRQAKIRARTRETSNRLFAVTQAALVRQLRGVYGPDVLGVRRDGTGRKRRDVIVVWDVTRGDPEQIHVLLIAVGKGQIDALNCPLVLTDSAMQRFFGQNAALSWRDLHHELEAPLCAAILFGVNWTQPTALRTLTGVLLLSRPDLPPMYTGPTVYATTWVPRAKIRDPRLRSFYDEANAGDVTPYERTAQTV